MNSKLTGNTYEIINGIVPININDVSVLMYEV